MSNNQQIKTVTAKGASEFVKEDAELQKDGYIFCLPKTRGTSKVAKDQWREVMSSVCGEANSDGKGSLLKPSMFFGGGNAVACDKCGTEGLGWMMWGPFNTLPNIVALLTSSLPYTAAGHKFNTDLLAGLGPQPMYRYTQYVGGNLTTKEIPYEDAGVLLKGWIRDLRREVSKLEYSDVEDSPLVKDLKEQIAELDKKYEKWQTHNVEIKSFIKDNNLQLYAINIAVDQTMFGISFPEIGLQQKTQEVMTDGKKRIAPNQTWVPKATSLSVRPCHTCRLEQMDDENKINYVYISNQWWNSAMSHPKDSKASDLEVAAIPALDPRHPFDTLSEKLRKTRESTTSIDDRPTRFILPTYYYTAGRPYYPVPAWYSVFGGDIYEFASTIISDRLTRKKNANIIGRIIYVHHDYLDSLYTQQTGPKKKTKEQLRDALYKEVNDWLANKNNSGSSMLAFTFIGRDNKEHDSWRVVEIESSSAKSTADANQKELQEISSIIFFAMGLDSQLIGNTPGTEGSRSGTDLRERYLLKQIQMSPTQQLILKPLEVINQQNGWDDCVWRIKREVLTTLDNSKTGITAAETE